MKINTLLLLLGVSLSAAVFAGEVNIVTAESTIVAPPTDSAADDGCRLTVKPGLMHTNVGSIVEGENSKVQNAPSLLYGASISANWDYMQKDGWTHSLGLSVGYYEGRQTSSWPSDYYMEPVKYKCSIKAVPIMLSYDFKKDISDSLAVYCGARTGAMVRDTGLYYDESVDSCTKVLPMLGLGAGIQMFTSDKWSLNLSYDFTWTFGRDADTMTPEWYKSPVDVSKSHRYYGTIGFGVSRSF